MCKIVPHCSDATDTGRFSHLAPDGRFERGPSDDANAHHSHLIVRRPRRPWNPGKPRWDRCR